MIRGFAIFLLRWALLLGLAMPAFGCAGGERSAVGQVRRVTPAAADSDCIGDPKTPLCALDTLFACASRLDFALCGRIGIGEGDAEMLIGQGPAGHDEWSQTTREYVVTETTVVTDAWLDRITDPYKKSSVRTGYVEISTIHRVCYDNIDPSDCIPWAVNKYIFKALDGDWQANSWEEHHSGYGIMFHTFP